MANTVELIVFTNENCEKCDEFKKWLDDRYVTYLEKDIHDAALDKLLVSEAMAASAEVGMAMPVAVLGGIGMTPEKVKKCEDTGLLPTVIGCLLVLLTTAGCNPIFPLL